MGMRLRIDGAFSAGEPAPSHAVAHVTFALAILPCAPVAVVECFGLPAAPLTRKAARENVEYARFQPLEGRVNGNWRLLDDLTPE